MITVRLKADTTDNHQTSVVSGFSGTGSGSKPEAESLPSFH